MNVRGASPSPTSTPAAFAAVRNCLARPRAATWLPRSTIWLHQRGIASRVASIAPLGRARLATREPTPRRASASPTSAMVRSRRTRADPTSSRSARSPRRSVPPRLQARSARASAPLRPVHACPSPRPRDPGALRGERADVLAAWRDGPIDTAAWRAPGVQQVRDAGAGARATPVFLAFRNLRPRPWGVMRARCARSASGASGRGRDRHGSEVRSAVAAGPDPRCIPRRRAPSEPRRPPRPRPSTQA
jgi:hypothetical protein